MTCFACFSSRLTSTVSLKASGGMFFPRCDAVTASAHWSFLKQRRSEGLSRSTKQERIRPDRLRESCGQSESGAEVEQTAGCHEPELPQKDHHSINAR